MPYPQTNITNKALFHGTQYQRGSTLILDELVRLERFRRIAKNHGFTLPEESMLPYKEVEYLQGLINAKIYLEAEPWMCPSWVVLSRKEIDTEEEHVTEFHNTLYRNW